jgi:hypothetical protein
LSKSGGLKIGNCPSTRAQGPKIRNWKLEIRIFPISLNPKKTSNNKQKHNQNLNFTTLPAISKENDPTTAQTNHHII